MAQEAEILASKNVIPRLLRVLIDVDDGSAEGKRVHRGIVSLASSYVVQFMDADVGGTVDRDTLKVLFRMLRLCSGEDAASVPSTPRVTASSPARTFSDADHSSPRNVSPAASPATTTVVETGSSPKAISSAAASGSGDAKKKAKKPKPSLSIATPDDDDDDDGIVIEEIGANAFPASADPNDASASGSSPFSFSNDHLLPDFSVVDLYTPADDVAFVLLGLIAVGYNNASAALRAEFASSDFLSIVFNTAVTAASQRLQLISLQVIKAMATGVVDAGFKLAMAGFTGTPLVDFLWDLTATALIPNSSLTPFVKPLPPAMISLPYEHVLNVAHECIEIMRRLQGTDVRFFIYIFLWSTRCGWFLG